MCGFVSVEKRINEIFSYIECLRVVDIYSSNGFAHFFCSFYFAMSYGGNDDDDDVTYSATLKLIRIVKKTVRGAS